MEISYVYIESELHSLWTVGFYSPSGEWQPESDHGSPEDAADRAAYLNGSTDKLRPVVNEVAAMLARFDTPSDAGRVRAFVGDLKQIVAKAGTR